MKRMHELMLVATVAATAAACSSTPPQVAELDTARAIVPQVEASPRAGVAATYVTEARRALDQANALAQQGGKVDEIQFQAIVATRNAQIANEKILTAQAQEQIEQGTAERQAVLIQAREMEAQRRAQQVSTLEQELAELRAQKTDRGMVLTLGDVLFDTGRANLKPGAYVTIDRLARVLMDDDSRQVLIEGHTDSTGSDELNMRLSESRANAVRMALLERGVPSRQIQAVGKGKNFPVASNDTASGRQQNRRVEMIFTDSAS